MRDREKLRQRLKSGRCLECGSSSHKVADCPHKKTRRPPTPRGASSRVYRDQKNVNFRVSGIAGDPPASGREGDEDQEAERIIDSYLESNLGNEDIQPEVYEDDYAHEYDADNASDSDYE